MADASRKAAASARKGGLPNALFLAEAAERLPGALAGRTDLVTVVLPWGSLLRGILAADGTIVAGLRDLLNPTGELMLLLSEIDRTQVDTLVNRLEGLDPLEVREARESDVTELSSGWARRLRIPGSRPARVIRLRPCQVASRPRAPWCRRPAGAPASSARGHGC